MACCLQKRVLNVKLPQGRCGGHVMSQSSLSRTMVQNSGCKCVQFYLGQPTTYDCKDITDEDKKQTLDFCTYNDMSFYIHCPVITNLAKIECSRSIQVVKKQLNIVNGLPGACVLHIGRVGTIEKVAQHLNDIIASGDLPVSQNSRVPFHLLLEIAPGQGSELGSSWEEIRHLYEALDYTRIGLCVDTQHAFASGICSFETSEDVVKLFDISNSIVNKGISLIHLNDSVKPYKSHVAKYAPLREGYIWSSSDESLRSLLQISQDYNLDLISESPNPIADVMLIERYLKQISK